MPDGFVSERFRTGTAKCGQDYSTIKRKDEYADPNQNA
jgi:hypothetical protein